MGQSGLDKVDAIEPFSVVEGESEPILDSNRRDCQGKRAGRSSLVVRQEWRLELRKQL